MAKKTELNLQEIMERIRRMQQNVDGLSDEKEKDARKKKAPSDEEIEKYVNAELAKDGTANKDSEAARHIADLMARNPKLKRELKTSLPTANAARKENMQKLRDAAGRKGMDKLKNDFLARKKKAAQAELKKIAQDRRRVDGDKAIDEKDALRGISAGRSRHPGNILLQPLVNRTALGPWDYRHNADYPLPKPKNSSEISYRTGGGELKGRLYNPDPKVDTGKVAIIFSGSGGPSGEYTPRIAREYLACGAKVVCMDYRGFGNSDSLSKSGKKISTYPSEQSLYQDGKDMLEYVTKEMKVKPENVILHGFSIGGAVASKVAADFTQEQQKKALAEGKSAHKLGGLVLHSATDSTYDVARRVVKNPLGIFTGFGGWAFGGGYNTRSHMQRLHKLDPDIPVHYVSGSKDAVDEEGKSDPDMLSLENTRLHDDPKAKFHNSSYRIGEMNHTGENVEAIDLFPLVEKGRDAHLGGPEIGPEQQKDAELPEAHAAGGE